MLTETELAAIEARVAALPRGKWTGYASGIVTIAGKVALTIYGPEAEATQLAAFIAAARTDIPALIADNRRLQAELAAERGKRQIQWAERAPLYIEE